MRGSWGEMMVVEEKDGCMVSYPYSCGWVLYILFYLHVLYRLPTPGDIPEGRVTRHRYHCFGIMLCSGNYDS